jgi:L-rhamnose mutarotase
MECHNNIADFWAEIKQSTINKSWRNVCPEFVSNDQDIEETPQQMSKEVVELERN